MLLIVFSFINFKTLIKGLSLLKSLFAALFTLLFALLSAILGE
jgi:hypothetical protein